MKQFEQHKSKAIHQLEKELTEAFRLGQSEEVLALKAELEETLKYAQEAYEFLKVVETRLSVLSNENQLERTTRSYLGCARKNLEEIKGLKE